MKYRHIFWDWNGTVMDDACAAFSAVNTMLTNRNLPTITFDQYREYIDVPIVRFYEKVMDMSKENMEALSEEFNSLWAENLSLCPLSEGIGDVLELLLKSGAKQYIFSSSQNKLIKHHLEKYGLGRYFTAVLGADDCHVGSKIERTRDYIVSNGISPADAVFIGDMVHDCEVAEEIGSDCILVSSGHQCLSALIQTNREVISSVKELPKIFNIL